MPDNNPGEAVTTFFRTRGNQRWQQGDGRGVVTEGEVEVRQFVPADTARDPRENWAAMNKRIATLEAREKELVGILEQAIAELGGFDRYSSDPLLAERAADFVEAARQTLANYKSQENER